VTKHTRISPRLADIADRLEADPLATDIPPATPVVGKTDTRPAHPSDAERWAIEDDSENTEEAGAPDKHIPLSETAPEEASIPDLREMFKKIPFRDGRELLENLRLDIFPDSFFD
jgi:hypothetical protein